MATIPWLADALRAAGLTVVEHPGWKTRGRPGTWVPRFGIVHATAAPRAQSDTTQVRIVRDGREGLAGPIANACVDRGGRWHVLAAGRCNTTIPGTSGPYSGLGNTYALGVEACNDNRDEPWSIGQYNAYVAGWAAIARKLGWGPDQLRGHREHTPGHKTDPTFNMAAFRAHVAGKLARQGGNDVGTLEGVQGQKLADMHFTLTGVPMPDGKGGQTRVPAHVALGVVLAKLDAIGGALTNYDSTFDGLAAQLDRIDRDVDEHAAQDQVRDESLAQQLNTMRDLLEALDSGTLTQDELVSRIRIQLDVPGNETNDDDQ